MSETSSQLCAHCRDVGPRRGGDCSPQLLRHFGGCSRTPLPSASSAPVPARRVYPAASRRQSALRLCCNGVLSDAELRIPTPCELSAAAAKPGDICLIAELSHSKVVIGYFNSASTKDSCVGELNFCGFLFLSSQCLINAFELTDRPQSIFTVVS